MKKHLSDEEWKYLIREAESYTGTIKEFCNLNNISDKTFYSKRKKLNSNKDDLNIELSPILIKPSDTTQNVQEVFINQNSVVFSQCIDDDKLTAIIRGIVK